MTVRLSATRAVDAFSGTLEDGVISLDVTDDPYTLLAADAVVFADTSGGRLDITLPEAPANGRKVVVKDSGGAAGTDRIRLARSGADTVEGGTSYDIDQNGAGCTVIYDAAAAVWRVSDLPVDMALNSVHRASVGLDHSYLAANLVDVVIAVADATGGATGAALTAQLNDLGGTARSKEGVFLIVASDTLYAGRDDMNANCTFGTASSGSILASGSGWAVVKAAADGSFACTVTNASDELVYFSAKTAEGGADAAANGVLVRGCLPDGATWSA